MGPQRSCGAHVHMGLTVRGALLCRQPASTTIRLWRAHLGFHMHVLLFTPTNRRKRHLCSGMDSNSTLRKRQQQHIA